MVHGHACRLAGEKAHQRCEEKEFLHVRKLPPPGETCVRAVCGVCQKKCQSGDSAPVVVSAEAVPAPANVRFGRDQLDRPNLGNREGFPTSPFNTAEVPR